MGGPATLTGGAQLVDAGTYFELVESTEKDRAGFNLSLLNEKVKSLYGAADPQADPDLAVMTLHKAKGLEFDNVFVVGLEEGLLPHSRSLLEKESLEEERRLLYVAITRARRKLFLSSARARFLYGARTSQSPSRFLSEIPQRLVYKDVKVKVDNKTTRTEGRVIVQDWEIEKESADDFKEIDSW